MPAKKTGKKATKPAATKKKAKAAPKKGIKKVAPKKAVKKPAKAAPKKAVKKTAKAAARKTAKKPSAKLKKGASYKCSICGVGIVVDEVCGCVEEHVFICCEKPMKKKGKKKAA